jgi:hypothetical protein
VFMGNKTGFTLEAITDQNGKLLLPDAVTLPAGQRVLITVLAQVSEITQVDEITQEPALDDWNRPEEDVAWSHLQQER